MSHSIDHRILEEAAQWLAQMQETPLTDKEQTKFTQWRNQSEAHQRAWARAERLLAKMGSLPTGLAKTTLEKSDDARNGRRTALKGIVTMLLAAPVGWLLWRHQPWQDWLAADYVALTGEKLDATLDDGSQITLNTATELDVRFDQRQRLLRLRKGEIYVQTAADSMQPPRPLLVQSAQGKAIALGTRFSVRQMEETTWVAVYEGAVQIQPAHAGESSYLTLQAGQQAYFTRDGVEQATAASEAHIAWRNGLLMADDMPLQQWATEIARYSGKTIEVAPAAQRLRISGAFPTNDLRRALQMLVDTHRIRARIEGDRVRIGG